jgi:hypothetical protein
VLAVGWRRYFESQVRLSVGLSVCLSICLSVDPSVCRSVRLSTASPRSPEPSIQTTADTRSLAQYWIIRGKFPASRGSILLVTFVAAGLILVSLVLVSTVDPTEFQPKT